MRSVLKFPFDAFDKHFVEMWKFHAKHFDGNLYYDLDFHERVFLVSLKSEEEKTFFLLHWGWGSNVDAIS